MTVALGLDLSLASSGLVVMKNSRVVAWENPKTVPKMMLEERIDIIVRRCSWMFRHYKPDIVVMESGARGGKFVDLSIYHLAGVVRWKMWRFQAPIVFVPPTTLKKEATGSGNAKKPEMLAIAREFWPACPNHDVADGFHLATYGVVNIGDLLQPA